MMTLIKAVLLFIIMLLGVCCARETIYNIYHKISDERLLIWFWIIECVLIAIYSAL